MEKEVWQREVEQIIRADVLLFAAAVGKNGNVTLLTGIDLLRLY
jgi:hypothetical protein